jgi:hypothetical protein
MHSFFSSKNLSIFNRINVKRTRACNDFFFLNQKSQKEIADFQEKIRKIKAQISTNLQDLHLNRKDFTHQTSKSSRSTPSASIFHPRNVKIRKICTQASRFHPQKL